MKKALFLLFLLAIPALLMADEPVRKWTSISGRTIFDASLDVAKDSDPEKVYLIKDGKRYMIPLKNLSKEDQDYVTRVRSGDTNPDTVVPAGVSEGGSSPKDDKPTVSPSIVPGKNQYVILIGVNEYAKPIQSLKYCINDMKLLALRFENIGVPKENIFLITDDSSVDRRPTGSNIRKMIRNATGLMGKKDQLIVVFSGHGVTLDGKSYLCPSDTDLKDINSLISLAWVYEQLGNCMAPQKIFILDAFRSELTDNVYKAHSSVRTMVAPIAPGVESVIQIASCSKSQFSWEDSSLQHGVFMYFLAEGLSGAAADKDGRVTLAELFSYTNTKTKQFVFQNFDKFQVPTSNMKDADDFCIGKLTNVSTPNVKPSDITPNVAPDEIDKKLEMLEHNSPFPPPPYFRWWHW